MKPYLKVKATAGTASAAAGAAGAALPLQALLAKLHIDMVDSQHICQASVRHEHTL